MTIELEVVGTWGGTWGGTGGTECTAQRVGKNRRCQQNGKHDVY